MPLRDIEKAIAAIGRGEIVIVVDDEDRENEGDLIMAAEFVTPEKIAFFVKHTSGLICAPITDERGFPSVVAGVINVGATSTMSWGFWSDASPAD